MSAATTSRVPAGSTPILANLLAQLELESFRPAGPPRRPRPVIRRAVRRAAP